MSAFVPFVGYAPDADPTTPGVITNCAALVPSMKGMKAAPSPQNNLLPALAAACQGAAVLRKLDDSTRFIAGTGTKLYEAGSSSWTDRTRASGNYAPGSDVRWRFAQFGDVSIAAVKSDTIQASSSTAFADVSGAPKAAIVETVGQFVIAFDTNEATYGDSPDRWYCCAIGDYTDWTPSIDTQCATGLLTSAPGKIVGAKRFGEQIIAYKARSMFLGTYVGAPYVWDFHQIPGEIGAPCHEVIVDIGTPEEPRHLFMGFEDFYQFDGSRPVPIGGQIKQTVFKALNKQYSFACFALHDYINSLVYFYYPTASSVNPDKCVVYNYKTGKWGRDDRSVECAVAYLSAGIAYDDLGNSYSTYADLPAISYDSSFWTSGFPVPAVFNTSHRIQTLDGAAGSSSLTTGDYGDDDVISLVTRIRPRFLTSPTSGSLTNFYRDNLGDSLTQDFTTTLSSGKFDFMRASRWHRDRMDFTGDMEITGVSPTIEQDGEE